MADRITQARSSCHAAQWISSTLSKAARSLDVSGMVPGLTAGPATSQTGRLAMALRFDGPHLERAGRRAQHRAHALLGVRAHRVGLELRGDGREVHERHNLAPAR